MYKWSLLGQEIPYTYKAWLVRRELVMLLSVVTYHRTVLTKSCLV